MIKVKKGDVVYLKKPMEKKGHIIGGNRPYVVVSNDIGNHFSEVCMVVPVTTNIVKKFPMHIPIDNVRHVATCEQIFTISQDDVQRVHHHLTDDEIKQIEHGLCVALGVAK